MFAHKRPEEKKVFFFFSGKPVPEKKFALSISTCTTGAMPVLKLACPCGTTGNLSAAGESQVSGRRVGAGRPPEIQNFTFFFAGRT